MKKLVLLGTALALSAMLMFSCNKNRFDFDHFESAQGSGQWKLPIGSMHISLDTILSQMVANQDLLSTNSDGDVQICYGFPLNDLVKGSSMLNLGTVNASAGIEFPNPFPGIAIDPIDTVFYFRQEVDLSADSASIETAIVKSGELILTVGGNIADFCSEIMMSSPDIIMPNGDSLHTTDSRVDLTGATFRMYDPVTGEPDSIFVINYAVRYLMTGIQDPNYDLTTIIAIRNLKLRELSGYIDSYVYEFSYDSAFQLPLSVDGQMTLVGAKMRVLEKNTFGNLNAQLRVDRAELYGGGATPASMFNNYPFVLNVIETPVFVDIAPEETINIGFNSKFNAFRFAGSFDLNPSSKNQLIHIYDTSSLSMKFNATIPMCFRSPGIYYQDTMDLHMSEMGASEILDEICLHLSFASMIPINLDAQFYTLDPNTGRVTDSLLVNPMHIAGAFDGQPVNSTSEISVTKERIKHFVESPQLAMRFGVDTNNKDVLLNLNSNYGMDITIKADVLYSVDVNVND